MYLPYRACRTRLSVTTLIVLRPLIERLWLEKASAGKVVLGMQLAARTGATARPEAVLEALGMGGAFARYHRRALIRTALPGAGRQPPLKKDG